MQGRTARETELRLLRISCAAHIALQGGSTHMTYFLIAITVSSNDDKYAYRSSVQTASRLGQTAVPATPRPNCEGSELLLRKML